CVDQMVPDSNHSDDQSRQSKMNREETVRNALESISRPEVHYQVLLASTPDVAMDIVEMLPGVKELVALGLEAGEAALSLWKTKRGFQLIIGLRSDCIYFTTSTHRELHARWRMLSLRSNSKGLTKNSRPVLFCVQPASLRTRRILLRMQPRRPGSFKAKTVN